MQAVLQCATRGFGPCRSSMWLATLFLYVSLLYVPEGFHMFWFLTVYVFRKFLFGSGFIPTCWHACQTLNTETIFWISCFSLNVIQFHVSTFMRFVNVTLLGKCFQIKPQPKQPNWSLDAVISLCRGCHFWLKMCGKIRAPTLPGTPHTFSIF